MTFQDVGSLGELVAAVATVATLVYLAIQIKQNTRAVRSSVLEATGARSIELAKFGAADEGLARILMIALSGEQELTDVEKFRLTLMFLAAMRSYEATVAQHTHGFLDAGQFSGREYNIGAWVHCTYFPEWWAKAKNNFSQELQALVDQVANDPGSHSYAFPLRQDKAKAPESGSAN